MSNLILQDYTVYILAEVAELEQVFDIQEFEVELIDFKSWMVV